MEATAWIERDHAVIKPVLAGINTMQRPAGAPFSLGLLAAATTFFAGFVRSHDEKEDRVLTPILAERGIPVDEEPLAGLTRDHEESERQLAALQAAARTRNAPIGSMIRAFVRLMGDHLAAEHDHLLPAVAQLRAPDVERVLNGCNRLDAERGGPTMDQRSVQLAGALARASATFGPEASPNALVAKRIMRIDLPPIFPTESLARAADLMRASGVRELPVLEYGLLVGLLAKTDLEPFCGHKEWTTVAVAMSREPVMVAPDERVAEVARLLGNRTFAAVPVVVEGVVLGIVGRRELLVALSGSTVH
jgi:CBS domain-containing protein